MSELDFKVGLALKFVGVGMILSIYKGYLVRCDIDVRDSLIE